MLGNGTHNERGILPRCIEQILTCTHGVAEITASYLQIYCEMVGDLLSTNNSTLSIRERAGQVFVEGLSKSRVSSMEDLQSLLDIGERNRATASTLMNATSSRRYFLFVIFYVRFYFD